MILRLMRCRRLISWWIIFTFILMPLTNTVEAKTYNYTGMTILHADSKEVADATSINWGVGGNQTHSMSIISGKDYITINSFNTQLNSVLSGLDRKYWGAMNDSNFPVVNSSYSSAYTYKDSDVMMYFKIGEDVGPAVSLVMQGRKASFPGYKFQNLTSNKLYTISYHPYEQAIGCGSPYTYSPGYIGDGPIKGSTNGGTFEQPSAHYFEIHTEAARPTLYASDIKDTRITLNWNPNGNDTGTSYTLQRRLNVSQTWSDVYTGNANQYTNTNLIPETEYQYRIRVNHIAGVDWNVFSLQGGQEYIVITTSTDPAVAFAQEASSKAQAAKEAAEQTLQYSTDAKRAAELVKAEVDNPEYGLQALNNKINNPAPYIQRIYNPQGDTFTFQQTFDIEIDAAGVQKNLVYRVICDNFDSGWTSSNLITINGLIKDGTKKVTIIISNNPNDPENGATVKGQFTFFKAIL